MIITILNIYTDYKRIIIISSIMTTRKRNCYILYISKINRFEKDGDKGIPTFVLPVIFKIKLH